MQALKLISSMTTRQLLRERAAAFTATGRPAVDVLATGGVEAARRVREGEAFDLVVLAAEPIDRLAAAGVLRDAERIDWVRSATAIAVAAGSARPDIASEAAVRRAVLAAPRIGLSTGPSGVALRDMFARWGIAEAVAAKTVQAPPGVAVGSFIARGEVDLGFQQVAELMDLDGIEIVGTLPQEIEIVTTFAAAVCRSAADPASAAAFLRFIADPASAESIRRHGMSPV